MRSKFRDKEFLSGLLFIFLGIMSIWLAREYPMGSARRMGPGYFPTIVGGLLTMLGLIQSFRSFFISNKPISFPTLRPLLMILLGVVGFALSLETLGLAIAALILILFSCLGRPGKIHLREVALLYLALVVMSILIFVYGLDLQFKIWPL